MLAWARSGAMALTGFANGEAQLCPAPLAACADGALACVRSLSLQPLPPELDGARLLGERAAIAGHARAGLRSSGGACRVVQAEDGALALNLARESDWDLLPAWLERDDVGDLATLEAALRECRLAPLVARGRELGLALAAVDTRHPQAARLFRLRAESASKGSSRRARPRVLDLSSLWAGPLCAHLLQLGGADVVKVESRARPDGARAGPPAFYDLLNAGKRSVALDFRSQNDRAVLLALLRAADIVIEASRPRALRQLGIEAEALLREREGLTWIALSGHGRDEPQAQWIAYGDDAGVDAGLNRIMARCCAAPLFVGDAIADPLTGLHAAALAWMSWHSGGSRLIDLSLSEVVRACIEFVPEGQRNWGAMHRAQQQLLRSAGAVIEPPRARRPQAAAAALGADNQAVFVEWSLRC